MSKFAQFMKSNKIEKENGFYAATKSLCDEKGKPLVWEFRPLTSKQNEEIRESCTVDVPILGKANMYRQKIKTGLYIQRMVASCVVTPDLYDSELQISYGANNPEDLLLAMVDDPGEYSDLVEFVQKFQGFDVSFEDKAQEAKN